MENGCIISNIRFLSSRVIFHWTMIMGERVTKKGSDGRCGEKKNIWEEHSWSYHLPSNVTDPGFLKRSGQTWHDFKKTNSICLTYSTCDLHEGLLFLFCSSEIWWMILKPSQTISGVTNSFHPDLVWPFWRQFWPASWVHDFIWRWVCNQVEDLIKHAKGSRKDASLKYTSRNASILHRNSDIGT